MSAAAAAAGASSLSTLQSAGARSCSSVGALDAEMQLGASAANYASSADESAGDEDEEDVDEEEDEGEDEDDEDDAPPAVAPLFGQGPLIYSEPAICYATLMSHSDLKKGGQSGQGGGGGAASSSSSHVNAGGRPKPPPSFAISDTCIQRLGLRHAPDSGISSLAVVEEALDEGNAAGNATNHAGTSAADGKMTKAERTSSRVGRFAVSTPRGSMFQSNDSMASYQRRHGHKNSFSTREIREQHAMVQDRYRPKRQRHYTDPVDFEGILNIIGGCTWWQILVYLLISIQQVPHSMFNLGVVYMMYSPDHWCDVPDFNDTSPEYKWSLKDTLNTSIVFPRGSNRQRGLADFHDQCTYYAREEGRYDELRRMPLAQAVEEAAQDQVRIVPCSRWQFDDKVMKRTIVTEWSLVCESNLMRGHAHLFYSLGYFFGCFLGGYASDQYGRKTTVIGFGILASVFAAILPASTAYYPVFLFVRFCSAVCNEAADLAAYVLCMEITGTRYRSMVGSLLQAPWAVGYSALALLAYLTRSWTYIQGITAALHFLAICIVGMIPESPRWLIVNDRSQEAEELIRKACREPIYPLSLFAKKASTLPGGLELVKHAEHRRWVSQDKSAKLFDIFRSTTMRYRSIALCFVWVSTALVYYGLVMALSDQSAPGRMLFRGNFFLNNAIAGAIELPTLIGCVYLMHFGRKHALVITLVAAVCFCVSAIVSIAAGGSSLLSLICMLAAKICIQGAFNILYIFTSEMYPTVIRNSAVGMHSMIARFGSGFASYLAILSDVTFQAVPMLCFCLLSLLAAVIIGLLPETGDRPLPDTLQDAVTFLRSSRKPRYYAGLDKRITQVEEAEAEECTAEVRKQHPDGGFMASLLASGGVVPPAARKASETSSETSDDDWRRRRPATAGPRAGSRTRRHHHQQQQQQPNNHSAKNDQQQQRQRHAAGPVSQPQPPPQLPPSLTRETSGGADSLAADLAVIQMPDHLSEPFAEDEDDSTPQPQENSNAI